MKLTRFEALGVHEYLSLRIDFDEKLTFLTGLNGSGKTTALRLLMALLSPLIEEFGAIKFRTAKVVIDQNGREIEIRAQQSAEGLDLSVTGVVDSLLITNVELEVLTRSVRQSESRSPLMEKIRHHSVYRNIVSLSTPMFLGLDRRFDITSEKVEYRSDLRRREAMLRHMMDDGSTIPNAESASLKDVYELFTSKMQEIRIRQAELDGKLRKEILAKAFQYKFETKRQFNRFPSRQELEHYKAQLTGMEIAAQGLGVPELNIILNQFLERINSVVTTLENLREEETDSNDPPDDLVDWVMNKPQFDRILDHIRLLEEYTNTITRLNEPTDRFLSLVNSFLQQTAKKVQLDKKGFLEVKLKHSGVGRPLSALSSGERQLLIMLAHLSLNPYLHGSSVFIVDEPELSLHIEWQERFVDAIIEANPGVQIIMATHSPAIVLDRNHNCRSLS